MTDPCINLHYVHSRSIGYGRLGVDLAAQLERQGIEVYDHMPGPDAAEELRMAHLNEGRKSGVAKVACWISTPTHATGWYDNQIPALLSMWEAQRLPEQFRESLHNFETIIVPSEQNRELFSQYHDNVKLVPLGIDPDRWTFSPRRMPTTSFRFMIGGSGPRKGTDLARKAFRAAFPHDKFVDGPRPVLVLKSPKGEEEYMGDNVEVIPGRLTDEAEVSLYESIHCYLQPSRGEGFGLQPLQAMAQGIPTILTNAHGHAGFAHLGMGLDTTDTTSAYFIYGDAGNWWEPDFDQLVEYMRWTYLNYEQACVRAMFSAEVIAEEWTWKHTADKFLDVLGRENLIVSTPGEWFKPTQKLYMLITSRDYTCDVGGTMRQFKQGERYWEPADVKRILFESGVLDPACLNLEPGQSIEDIGLVEAQLADVADYTAAHAHCVTCGQRLNSGPTKADEIFEQLQREAGVT